MIKTEDLIPELFSSPKSIVLVTDTALRIRYASEAVERIFNIRPVSLMGKNVLDFLPEEQRAKWAQIVLHSSDGGTNEITLPGPHATELHFDVAVSNHVSHDRIQGLVIHLHDITNQKQDLRKLSDANAHLDHFIFKTTHDLKAPLRSAMGLLRLAQSAAESEKDQYLHLLHKSLLRLDAFIEEVNSFYRNDKLAISREPVDVQKLIAEQLEFLANLPEAKDVDIQVSVLTEHTLHSDSVRLKTIIANILSNSFKYQDEKKVYKKIQIRGSVTPDGLDLIIEDNGIGIATDHINKIFDMFYRANDTTQGTGLGLYIVKDTVQRLGGTIELHSHEGVGTRFSIHVPNAVVRQQQPAS